MGFGQHTNSGRAGKTAGYPVPRNQVKIGRMTTPQIMQGVSDTDIVKTERTGHNEVKRTLSDGRVIYRLRETDIITFYPTGIVLINTGGRNTMTTRRHLMDILKRHNFQTTIWADKKGGGNILKLWKHDKMREFRFIQSLVIFPRGESFSDVGRVS
jgi:hypothetical protein